MADKPYKLLEELADRLRKIFAEDVISIVLYGSAAAGDHDDAFSDLNVLCVLKRITPRELGLAEPVFRWWQSQKNPSPLLLSEEEVQNSTDCFPIEFLDMKSAHRVIFGADVISGIEIDDSFHRGQVEHELRAKLLRLRQKAAGVLGDKAMLTRLMADSVSTFCTLARHALLLSGAEAPRQKRAAIEACVPAFGIDPQPFYTLLDLREGTKKPRELDPPELLAAYMAQIDRLVTAVDRLRK